jgi:hypothetical protein
MSFFILTLDCPQILYRRYTKWRSDASWQREQGIEK